MKAAAFSTLARQLSIPLLAGTLLCAVGNTQAQVYTLTDGNSTARIDLGGPGMYNWTVDGTDQLVRQWFWYRVGTVGGEASLSSVTLSSHTPTGANQLVAEYTSAGLFSVRVDYLLSGGLPGSGVSGINESITINNLSQSPLDFHFFQYSDFDLIGTTANDVGALDTDILGNFNYALQGDGSLLGPLFTEAVLTPGATHGEVALFPSILNRLNDAAPTVLTDAAGPIGPGDITWAFQWDLTIPVGGSELISKVKSLTVPEPSCLALVSLGLVAFFARRRARQ